MCEMILFLNLSKSARQRGIRITHDLIVALLVAAQWRHGPANQINARSFLNTRRMHYDALTIPVLNVTQDILIHKNSKNSSLSGEFENENRFLFIVYAPSNSKKCHFQKSPYPKNHLKRPCAKSNGSKNSDRGIQKNVAHLSTYFPISSYTIFLKLRSFAASGDDCESVITTQRGSAISRTLCGHQMNGVSFVQL